MRLHASGAHLLCCGLLFPESRGIKAAANTRLLT